MEGGAISNNTTSGARAGGVFVGGGTTFTMSGGEVKGNKTSSSGEGGGVYVTGGTFNLSGKVDISGNTDSSGSSNVYLDTDNDVITVQGKLKNTEPIGVKASPEVDFTKGFKAKMPDTDPADFFAADMANHGVLWNDEETEVKIVPANTVIFDNNIASDPKTKKQYVLPKTTTELRANPFTWPAHSFTGWNTKADGSGTAYADKAKVTLDENQNLELYAQWKASELTVSPIDDQTWTGQPITPTVTVKDGDTTLTLDTDYTVAYAGNTDVGTATVTVTGKGDYESVTAVNANFKILKANATMTAPTANDLTYTGAAQALVTAGSAEGGELQYALGTDTEPTGEYSTAIPTGIEADTYYVWYKVVGDANHNDIAPAHIAVTIKPEGSDIEPVADKLVYNGKPQALVKPGSATGGTLQYALGEDDVTAPESGWSEKIPEGTDAGTYYVWYRVVADANHNDVPPACVIAEIAKASIAPTVRITGWTYGETPNAPSVSQNPGKGAVTYTYSDSADGKFKKKVPVNAGTWYVKAKVAETDNYLGATTDPKSFAIARATATVTADSLSKAKGEADPTLTATVKGLVNGDDESVITYTLKREAGEKVGTYAITPKGKAEQGNYAVTYVEGTFTITDKPDPEGMVLAKLSSTGSRRLKLAWTEMKGAEGYDVFFSLCSNGSASRKLTYQATVRAGQPMEYKFKKLKKGRCYKASVKAWVKRDGKKEYVCESPVVHCITGNASSHTTNAKSVKLNKTKLTLVAGEAAKLSMRTKAIVKGKSLLDHGARCRFYSTDESVAIVDDDGNVTGVGGGKCEIYAMAANGEYATCKVKVHPAPKSVKFKKKAYSVDKGQTLNLKQCLKLDPTNAKTKYTWTSSNRKIARVNGKGVVKGVKPGSVTITVKTANGKTAKVKVTVQ